MLLHITIEDLLLLHLLIQFVVLFLHLKALVFELLYLLGSPLVTVVICSRGRSYLILILFKELLHLSNFSSEVLMLNTQPSCLSLTHFIIAYGTTSTFFSPSSRLCFLHLSLKLAVFLFQLGDTFHILILLGGQLSMQISQLFVEMEHLLGIIAIAFSSRCRTLLVLCWCLRLLLQLLNQLFAFGKLLFEFEIASLRVIELILEHGLLALQLFLMLFNQNQLLIFHILQPILEVAKLALTVSHLFDGGLHIILNLFFTVLRLSQLLTEDTLSVLLFLYADISLFLLLL